MSPGCKWTGYRTEGGQSADASRGDKERAAARMKVEEAARSLGIKEESVRKRVRRKKIRSEKDEDGRLYVYVYATKTIRGERADLYPGRSADESGYVARELIESKDESTRILQVQLQEEREARRRAPTRASRSSPGPMQFSPSGFSSWKLLRCARRPPRGVREARQGRSRKVRACLTALRGPGTPPSSRCAGR